jgi:MFS family permease
LFFKLPSGALSDVLGRKRIMVLVALFFAAPPFLYPLVHDPWSLLALRFIHGFATAIFSPVAAAYVASLGETGRGARLGWFSSANDVGATGGPMVGGFVLYFTASFSLTYLLVGALGVLTLLVVLLLPDVDRPAPEAKTFAVRAAEFRQGLAEVLRTPPIFVAAGIEAVMYLGYGAFSASCRSMPAKSGSTMPRSPSSSARSWRSPWWRSRSPDACPTGSGAYPSSSSASCSAPPPCR